MRGAGDIESDLHGRSCMISALSRWASPQTAALDGFKTECVCTDGVANGYVLTVFSDVFS